MGNIFQQRNRNTAAQYSIITGILCIARRHAECAFVILSNKWRIFQRPFNVSPDSAVDLVRPVLLCKIWFPRDGYKFENALTVSGLEDVPDGQSVRGRLTVNNV
jgi:hypothetical protein